MKALRIAHARVSARASDPASRNAFVAVCVLVFAASATVTIAWCRSMSAMGQMPVSGGRSTPMVWSPMVGQTWVGAAISFVGMWVTMMVAMMLPPILPTLLHYRVEYEKSETYPSVPAALVALGYFFVWALCGVAIFPLGAALAAAEHRLPALARAAPHAVGAIVLLAGALQFTAWRTHHLAAWRNTPAHVGASSASGALRLGVRLGLHCLYCCVGPTAVLLALGVMDLRAMGVVTACVAAERLAPPGERVARVVGVLGVAAGLLLIAHAVAGPAR